MSDSYDSEGASRSSHEVASLQQEAAFAQGQVDELRESVVVLASRVHGLSSALDVVNEVQRAQQSVDRRTIEAMEEARKATATANRAENSVVPREELDARNAAEERLRRWDRKMLLRKVYGAVFAALLVCGALGSIALSQHHYQQHTRQQVDSLNRLIYGSCLGRNQQLDQQRRLYRKLIEAEHAVADPRDLPRTTLRIQAYQAVLDNTGTLLDCEQFRRTIR